MQKILLLIILIGLMSFDEPKLKKREVSEGITMLVPIDWRQMDGLDFSERFPSVRAPLAAYSDANREMALSVNISATQWPDEDAEIARDFFKSSIYNTFDRIEMIDQGVYEANKHKFVFFEFESTVKGDKSVLGQEGSIMNYSYIQYMIGGDRALVFSFHCPKRLRQEWQEPAGKIMKSIKVKSKPKVKG
jgi:hypothetical protein